MMKQNTSLIHPKLTYGDKNFSLFARDVREESVIFLTYPEMPEQTKKKLISVFHNKDVLFVEYPFGYPDIDELNDFHYEFWQNNPTDNALLIGFGGGSVLDCAKVLRFGCEQKNWLKAAVDKPFKGENSRKLPLALIPTTSGTGSEVTPTATIWNKAQTSKHSFYGDAVYADYAVVSGEFSLGLGWSASRDAALDALSHALEALWNINRTFETNEYAIVAARLILQNLPKMHNNLENVALRNHLSCASLLAGIAMSKTQTALAHALSYEMTLKTKVSHGAAVAYWLPYTWQLLNQSHDAVGKQLIEKALVRLGSKPQNLTDWLNSLGILCHPLNDFSPETIEKISKMLASARGKNFSIYKQDLNNG